MPRRSFNHFRAAALGVERGAELLVEKATQDIAANAGANAPIDTGALAESYTANVEGTEGEAGTNMEYGPHVEFGTRTTGAQPHLVPAAESVARGMGQYARLVGREAEEGARRG